MGYACVGKISVLAAIDNIKEWLGDGVIADYDDRRYQRNY